VPERREALSSPASGALHKIAVVGKDNIWAVGGVNGATLIQHWDGTSWTVVPSPNRGNGDLFEMSSESRVPKRSIL
jgi:hypothetical protein